ncbi:MAG: type II toxin-antitoxin system RelE/ParE family toxin [Lachnospiraceae bacterium]|nr:type II toxin-antitoxin system RelE/ParE family toxin [Lachnospiraceae bacterium]
MEDFQIKFYRTENGDCPVEDFLDQLDDKMQTKVLRMISLLKNYGNDLREPYSKHMKDGIFELRISQGSDISRILYFYTSRKTIVLTNGFIKKTPKTPEKEIKKAERCRKDYAERKTTHG